MKSIKTVALSFIALACATSVQAKITKSYTAYVQPKNSNGEYVEFLSHLSGWSCSSSIGSTFSSVQLDSKGLEKRITRDRDWDYNFSTLYQGQPSLRMDFEHNIDNKSPSISISMSERCEKQYVEYEWVDVTDPSTGKTTQEYQAVTKTKSIHKSWNCSLSESMLPTREGGVREGVCSTGSYSYHDFDLDSILLSQLKEKTIHFALKYNGSQESFIELNQAAQVANEEGADRFIFNVSQGLSGGTLEDDFSIFMKVDGVTHEFKTKNGLINEDFVAYVPKGQNHLNIEFSGVEADLFSDDIYNAMSSIKLYKNSKSDRIVTLTSRGLLAEGDRSMIRVKLIRGPGIEKSSSPASQISERMQLEIAKQKSLVLAKMENIENIRRELLRAEGNYSLAKTISIPVSIAGAGLIAFGTYGMWTGEGIDTKEILMAGTGGVMIAASATSIILTSSQVNDLIEKLKEVESDFQEALEKLEEKQLKFEEGELRLADQF